MKNNLSHFKTRKKALLFSIELEILASAVGCEENKKGMQIE